MPKKDSVYLRYLKKPNDKTKSVKYFLPKMSRPSTTQREV